MKTGKLSRSTTSPFLESEGSPMESIANIVDVMLVFACGLLLALVTVWNVDIGLDRPDNMYEVSDVVNESGTLWVASRVPSALSTSNS